METVKKNKVERCRKNQSFKKASFLSFKEIIDMYWDDFNETLEKAKFEDIDQRLIDSIEALKKVDEWKSNLFIVYLHYGKPSVLAKKLNVKVNSLSALLSMIKKEIKWKL